MIRRRFLEGGLAIGAAAVGAGRREPRHFADQLRGQPQAVGHERLAVAIIGAARGRMIEQAAGDVGLDDRAGVLVLYLVQAAAAAAVAQRFPLAPVERCQRFLPKWRAGIHDKATIALLTGADQGGSMG